MSEQEKGVDQGDTGTLVIPVTIEHRTHLGGLRTASATSALRLLEQISRCPEGVEQAKVIEERGGAPPFVTVEEIKVLQRAQLIEVLDQGVERFKVSPFGLIELGMDRVMKPDFVEAALKTALDKLEGEPPDLPPEKYGNEEFRFTWESVHRLLGRIIKDHNAHRKIKIATLGCPMVGLFLRECYKLIGAASIFDINSDMVNLIQDSCFDESHGKITAAQYNALDEFPQTLAQMYDAVVIDPPWHTEHYLLFADRAWEMLRPHGRLYMSTFGPATRPEALEELSELQDRFRAGGYYLVEMTPEYFGYAIPEYERLVYRNQGIDVRSRGNYGQLMVLEKRGSRDEACTMERHVSELTEERCAHLSSRNGNHPVSVWIRRDESLDLEGRLEIEVMNDGGVYETTSRSQRRQDGVNIITGSHIGYVVSNPLCLIELYTLWLEANADKEGALEMALERYDVSDRDSLMRNIECVFDFLSEAFLEE